MIPWTTFHVTDLPKIPDRFLPEFEPALYNQQPTLWHKKSNRMLTRPDGSVTPNIDYDRWQISQEFERWVSDHICGTYLNVGISVSDPGEFTNTHGPHVDETRDAALLWMYDTGGPEVITMFWQQQGQPVVQLQRSNYPTEYADLIEIDQRHYQSGHWYLLNTHVMHGVENIRSRRVALHVSLEWHHIAGIQTKFIELENLMYKYS